MEINITKETDKEIFEIIEKLKQQGHYQEDEMCMRIETPFVINPDLREDRRNRIFMVLYPELLSYYHETDKWVTVPWICARYQVSGDGSFDEKSQRELCKWTSDLMKEIGYKPFYDEGAFNGHFSKNKRATGDKDIEFKMYINPSFPDGYWSNHTL